MVQDRSGDPSFSGTWKVQEGWELRVAPTVRNWGDTWSVQTVPQPDPTGEMAQPTAERGNWRLKE